MESSLQSRFLESTKGKKNDLVIESLENLSFEVRSALDIYKEGVSSELSRSLELFHSQPVAGLLGLLDQAQRMTWIGILSTYVIPMILKKKDLIANAFLIRSIPSVLHLAIVLKEDNRKNRSFFYRLMDDYEHSVLNEKIKLVIQFYPTEMIEDLNIEDTLI